MAFESLAYRFSFDVENFPCRWLPLIHLYDPDLPLFPIYYFHVLEEGLPADQRPLDTQRVFGYVEKLNLLGNDRVQATVITNKDLDDSNNSVYQRLVIREAKERFGLGNPVTSADVQTPFLPPLNEANLVLPEMWQRVVSNAYGNMLPFGRLWDEVLGLTRFVASWNSPGGRKGELIQTHYFASKFGVRIQSAGQVPQVDFYLFPTIKELTDPLNPINSFPQYSKLANIAHQFQQGFCSTMNVDGITLSRFNNPFPGRFNTQKIMAIIQSANIRQDYRPLVIECFNTFDKGPQRTIIFLMLLDDLRQRRLAPSSLTSAQCGSIYDGLARSYQSPKVIQIYAQQSFGNTSAIPIDTWIKTFFKWPLKIYPVQNISNKFRFIFSHSQNLGKVERLLWVSGQARKVHSSACDDALWCLKYGSSKQPRGANPLSCNICLDTIRNCCPAYNEIKSRRIVFNPSTDPTDDFSIRTSAGNNTRPNQKFISCAGKSIYEQILDDFSPADVPNGFAPFPSHNLDGPSISVEDFIRIY